jgi:hypothetical protein
MEVLVALRDHPGVATALGLRHGLSRGDRTSLEHKRGHPAKLELLGYLGASHAGTDHDHRRGRRQRHLMAEPPISDGRHDALGKAASRPVEHLKLDKTSATRNVPSK